MSTISHKKFHPQLIPSLFCLFFFVLFIYLGIWQIHRYQYKNALINTYQTASRAAPLSLNTVNLNKPPAFLHLTAEGIFLNKKSMLIDHQDNNGRIGYEVITPFQPSHSHRILLVNRGWIPIESVGAIQTNNLNPTAAVLKPIANKQTITGYIKLPEYTFTLGPNIIHPNEFPLVIQKIDIAQIEKLEHWNLYPFILRLDKKAAHGFLRNWELFNILPQRHMAYAIQWFAMALVLAIAYIIFSRKLDDDSHDKKK